MNHSKAMFGISVFKRSITRNVIAEITKYMHDNFADCMVILVDLPEAHNWFLRGRDSRQHALEIVKKHGELRVKSVQKALRRNGISMPVHTWDLLVGNAGYQQNLTSICDYYNQNKKFQNEVKSKLLEYLSENIREAELRHGRKLTAEELDESAHFLLEEIAGLSHLHFGLGYNVDIYPDTNNVLVDDIFKGKAFQDLGNKLGVKPSSYKYIHLPVAI